MTRLLTTRRGLIAVAMTTMLLLAACGKTRAQEDASAPEVPTVVQLAPGISATVVPSVDINMPGAMFMCSRCFASYPLREVHIVPTYYERNKSYVGSNRCEKCWRPSLQETRARFLANPTDDEGVSILMPVSTRVPKDKLRSYTAGHSVPESVVAVLDAIEKGGLVLSP